MKIEIGYREGTPREIVSLTDEDSGVVYERS
jgi:hypothetical protein